MSSDLEILHDFLKNPISLDLEKLKYGRGSALLTTDSGREIKLPIFDANDIFQKVRFQSFQDSWNCKRFGFDILIRVL